MELIGHDENQAHKFLGGILGFISCISFEPRCGWKPRANGNDEKTGVKIKHVANKSTKQREPCCKTTQIITKRALKHRIQNARNMGHTLV